MAKLKTGRHTSALKEARRSVKREARNTTVKSALSTLVKKVETAVSKKDAASAKTLLNTLFSAYDKAAKRNIIHKSKADNQKARLSKLVSSVK